jgi:glycosyltransferase involved in cell wall biosynthesis
VRILVCNWKDRSHPRAGGAEVWTHGVMKALVNDGHDVTLACSAAPGLAERDEWHGIEIVRGGDYRLSVHAHARRLYEQRHGKFDLVVDEINTRPFLAPRWAHSSQVIAFVHQVAREVWFRETVLPLAVVGRYLLEPWWLRAYREVPVCTPSVSSARSLRQYGIEHAVALPQGSDRVDVGEPAAKAANPTFVFVGRLCGMKRPEHAIRAIRSVQRSVPGATLWIVGDGPAARTLRHHAGRGVELLGALPTYERDDRIALAHALVCTSVREGWGLVVSEAAALGTGTVGYAVPGLVDSIGASGGILVPPDPTALAAELLAIALDPSRVPVPVATGTKPFSVVARSLLAEAEVAARA